MNSGVNTLGKEKTSSPKPSLNWGQGLISKSQPQTVLSLPSPVVSTELFTEFSNSTKTERTNDTTTEVPSVLPQPLKYPQYFLKVLKQWLLLWKRNATFAQNKGDYRNYECKINIENYMKR
jgi:hypothetical protein